MKSSNEMNTNYKKVCTYTAYKKSLPDVPCIE